MSFKFTVAFTTLKSWFQTLALRIRPRLPLLLLASTIALLAGSSAGFTQRPASLTSRKAPSDQTEEVKKAIYKSIEGAKDVFGYLIFDVQVEDVQFTNDRGWATARLVFRDPATLQTIPTEPGLAVAQQEVGIWTAFLPSTPGWDAALSQLPDDLLPADARESWLAQFSLNQQASDLGPFTGYLLPWAGGEEKYLTRSITHGIGSSSHYAFDFAQPGYPSVMFPVYASKSGWVKYVSWSYPNGYDDGNCNHHNYVVTEHQDTVPTSYTMYIHLAKDSIPLPLRSPGAFVVQGQYIGLADDTGCSSGNHLHIQTHTNPYSYWGNSVDMVFSDVPINGGRPRTPDEASQYPEHGAEGQHYYTSGNTVQGDVTPPYGEIQTPQTGDEIDSVNLPVSGAVADSGSGVSQYQLAYTSSGIWHDTGDPQYGPWFSQELDICSTGAQDGPFSLALQVWDQAGNSAFPAGITHLIKDYSCPTPPPACIPGPGQAAIFTDAFFQGTCSIFDPGEYLSGDLGVVGPDQAASVLIGQAAAATLYSQDGFQGRSTTIIASDPNLGEDPVPQDTLESLIVAPSSHLPSAPVPVWPSAGGQFLDSDSVDFSWLDTGGGAEYEFQVLGPVARTSPWQGDPLWSIGSLPEGAYTWQVRSRNPAGTGGWSSPRAVTILPDPAPPPPEFPLPYAEGFESGMPGWTVSGLWHVTTNPEMVRSGTKSAWFADPVSGGYETGGVSWGDLSSPSFEIPSTGYTFRFWYLYETENIEGPWDPRRVQISVNGEPFQNLYRMQDDEPGVWLQSPAISLDAYAGQSVRLRFHFSTIDAELNDFLGWAVDDLTIAQEALAACLDPNEPNDSPAGAAEISYGADFAADICSSGDLDYFTFEGSAGDRVYVDIDAEVNGSSLDSYLFLLAADGTSVLASNDDEVLFTRHDSQIGFTLPETAAYFLKVRAWDHPGAGSPAHSYRLRVGADSGDPDLSLSAPASYSFLPTGSTELSATASDGQTEISHVEFLWHDYDWTDASWSVLHDDWDGSDGWNATFDADSHPEGSGLAFVAKSYDLAGNVASEGAWEIGIDRTPPATTILPLPPTHGSTAAWISWQAIDNISGIDTLELQVSIDGGVWQDYGENISGYAQGTWFIGEPGQLVDFRMRAADLAGNVEEYPAGAETTTFLLPCSSPDPWEPDDTASGATSVTPGSIPQSHNFCLPSDQDWVRLDALTGVHYRIFALPASPDSAARIEIYEADGTTLLNSQSASEFGRFLEAGFTAPETGSYFIRLTHIRPQVAGDQVAYLVWIEEGYETSLPNVSQTSDP